MAVMPAVVAVLWDEPRPRYAALQLEQRQQQRQRASCCAREVQPFVAALQLVPAVMQQWISMQLARPAQRSRCCI
jgi:hypothetical protein